MTASQLKHDYMEALEAIKRDGNVIIQTDIDDVIAIEDPEFIGLITTWLHLKIGVLSMRIINTRADGK